MLKLKPYIDELEYIKYIFDTGQYNFIHHKINRLQIKLALSTNDCEFIESLHLIYIFALAIISYYAKHDNNEFYHITKTFLYYCYKTSSYYINLLNLYIKNDDNKVQIKNIKLLTVVNFIVKYRNKFVELF